MTTRQDVIAVIVNNEFQEQYYTNENQLATYIESVRSAGHDAKALVVPYYKFLALLNIQELVSTYPDFNSIMLAIEQFPLDQQESIYKNISMIHKSAFAKEYLDYFVANRLLLSSDPEFMPEFAERENTASYKAYVQLQTNFLTDLLTTLE